MKTYRSLSGFHSKGPWLLDTVVWFIKTDLINLITEGLSIPNDFFTYNRSVGMSTQQTGAAKSD